MTYPDLLIATMLNENFIPVQMSVAEASGMVQKFQMVWTPNLNFLDEAGNLLYRHEGYLPPPDYAALLYTALGQYLLRRKEYGKASAAFREGWERFPTGLFAAESLYYLGVGEYLGSQDVEKLKDSWRQLQKFYPYSSWAVSSNV